MASVHAISNTAPVLSTMQVPLSYKQSLAQDESRIEQKWTYLLANTIRFSDKPAYSIRLTKPAQANLAGWMEKIIIQGQCNRLFVEHLSLDEISFKRIKHLCNEHGVTLINLMHQQDLQANVVKGPW